MWQNIKENKIILWHDASRISLQLLDEVDSSICKILNVGDKVYLMTTKHSLYYGDLINNNNKNNVDESSLALHLKKSDICAIDIAVNSENLFVVNNIGHVFKINVNDFSIINTITIKVEKTFCKHGYAKTNGYNKIKSIAVNENCALFITESGELWATGDQDEINIKSEEPNKVIFFNDYIVSDIACGVNFYVVLARKRNLLDPKENNENDKNEEELAIQACPDCLKYTSVDADASFSENFASYFTDSYSNLRTDKNSIDFANKASKTDAIEAQPAVHLEKSGESSEGKHETVTTEQLTQSSTLSNNNNIIKCEAAQEEINCDIKSSHFNSPSSDIFKHNVFNIANFVFESVKVTQEKVATLTKHISSGSSDIEIKDNLSENNFEILIAEDTKKSIGNSSDNLNVKDDLSCSISSTNSSENGSLQQYLNERSNSLVQKGAHVLSTELWTWGDVKYGQLGVGDAVVNKNKNVPRKVTKLNRLGIKKIVCGSYHTVALTLDGRVFTWGRNNFMQVAHCSQIDQKSPQLLTSNFFLQLSKEERVKDIAAGCNHSLIVTDNKICLMGKHRSSSVMLTLDVPELKGNMFRKTFASKSMSSCTLTDDSLKDISNILMDEQIFLDDLLYIYHNLVIPFQKKNGASKELNPYEAVCQSYNNFLNIHVLYVQSLWDFYNGSDGITDIFIISYIDEFIKLYKNYLKAVCDLISINGFCQLAKLINVLQEFMTGFKEKLLSEKIEPEITNEAVISFVFQYPIKQQKRYISSINILIEKYEFEVEKLKEIKGKLEFLSKEQEKLLKEAEYTKKFWEGWKGIEQFKSPERRIIKESQSSPVFLKNAGRFSSHSFVLLTDIFIHISGSNYTAHPLSLVWVELVPEVEHLDNALLLTTPEEKYTLYTTSASERSEWFHVLQNAISISLHKHANHRPPRVRTGSFKFVKHHTYKDAIFNGQWLNGKLHGSGKIEWADNRNYIGQFNNGSIHGLGRMEMPSQGIYEGQWREGLQNGYGTMNYINGDVYEGYFKDGQPHGYGMKKEGHFVASVACVYVGEWNNGQKEGYGVMDDIKTGEKYLGSWHNNIKHGNGIIVTIDGIYYEGNFVHDVFNGIGIMVLEDHTYYEGEFKSVGIFGGKGTLTFTNGETLDGNFSGSWNEGIKVTATLKINNKSEDNSIANRPKSFGKLCFPAEQKWRTVFQHYHQQLGLIDTQVKSKNSSKKFDSQRLWQNVAAIVSKSQRSKKHTNKLNDTFDSPVKFQRDVLQVDDHLNKILYFNQEKLSFSAYTEIHKYLIKAFESSHHPLGCLLTELTTVYTATYGGVRVHPLLLEHAISELRSITLRIYEIVTYFFPQLPNIGDEYVLHSNEGNSITIISGTAIIYPILLPRVHSTLFILYTLHNKKNDDAYRERLLKWNRQPNSTLLSFLGVDQKFWKGLDESNIEDSFLCDAIESFQQLKNTFSAVEKLIVVRDTQKKIEMAIHSKLKDCELPADELIPMFYFVVIRASILQLGSEIHFITDFMEPYLKNGEYGYAFTTVEGIYDHILKEKISADF